MLPLPIPPSNSQTLTPSNSPTFKLAKSQTLKLSNSQTFRLSHPQTLRLSDSQTLPLSHSQNLDSQTLKLSDSHAHKVFGLHPLPIRGPSWGHPMLVLGALGSFLEPFCGQTLPKVDKLCSKLTFEIPPRRALGGTPTPCIAARPTCCFRKRGCAGRGERERERRR